MNGRVIVTYGRSLMAVVIAQSLSKKGIDVISCDSVGMTAAGFSKHTSDNFIHADLADGEDAYIDDMIKFVKDYRPDDGRPYLLMPAFRDAKILSQHAHRFDGLITLAVADYGAMNSVDPKQNLLETLTSLDVPAPKTFHPQTGDALAKALDNIAMPALVKAVDEVGGRGIDFVSDADDFKDLATQRMQNETPPPILQEAAPGHDYCLGVIYDHGKLIAHMAYHNLQTLPFEGGAGAMRETVDDAPFLEAANTLMGHLKWHGIAEIDFMWTGRPEDTPQLIEVNPRFWAGLFQSVESGVNFPWILYQLFAFGTVTDVEPAEIGTTSKIPGAWAAGAMRDVFSDKIDYDGARDAWGDMLAQIKDDDGRAAFESFKTACARLTDFSDAVDFFKSQRIDAKTAKSELMLEDDPMTSLGIFFVLSSLVRHGKLPDELK